MVIRNREGMGKGIVMMSSLLIDRIGIEVGDWSGCPPTHKPMANSLENSPNPIRNSLLDGGRLPVRKGIPYRKLIEMGIGGDCGGRRGVF